MNAVDYSYFFYDPNVGIKFFPTEDAALQAARESIKAYQEDIDECGWPEDELDMLAVGHVTHVAQQTNRVECPPSENLDAEGFGPDGRCWGNGADYYCNYEMLPLLGDASTYSPG